MLVHIQRSADLRHSGGRYPRRHGPTEMSYPPEADVVARELSAKICGEVRFDAGSRALYATDGSNYRQVPIGVVIPRTLDDVLSTVETCRQYGLPILSRGGGTSLAGQCCNLAVVIEWSKYLNRVLEIDAPNRRARVQPGCVLDTLRKSARKVGLTFGPDPSTHTHCTLGGMAGNNSCGVHSQMSGRTADNIESIDVLTYDGTRFTASATSEDELETIIRNGGRRGEIYRKLRDLRDRYAGLVRQRYPKIPRRVSGYNLDELLPENGFHVARALVGTEATCVTFLEITTRLVHWWSQRALVVVGYEDVFAAGDDIPEVAQHGPIGLEGLDRVLLDYMEKKHLHEEDLGLLPEGGGFLLAEFGGDTEPEADAKARAFVEAMERRGRKCKLLTEEVKQAEIWEIRESGLGATAFVPGEPDTWEGWEDSAVPPDRVGDYLRELKALYNKHGYRASVYGHFGQGCIHTRIPFDLVTREGIDNYRRFAHEAADIVVRMGGSLSGEHGDGQSRAEMLEKMYGPELLRAFEEFKAIWDPDDKMNPGKVVRPYRMDQNLRLGAEYNPPQPRTHFSFHLDHHEFSKATLRCVGVGKCRREEGGTMCPSWKVTHEEKHTTRGRAHLLWEMMQGEPLAGWRNEHVKEALDLCLSCKGCKGDCPVNVDIATYKAEFLAHYYAGRMRPRHAYASGLIAWWARLASHAPGAVNFLTQTPGLSTLAKFAAGYAQERDIPRFAPEPFKRWYAKRGTRNPNGRPVLLWPDTFNNYLTPEIAKSAVTVLEHAGYKVIVPEQHLCCGRPLYDFGMLSMARKWLEGTIATLRPHIQAGTPMVGLEPSCVAVFRDEMPDLLYGDLDAERLGRQTFLLSEFLQDSDSRPLPQMRRKAIIHGHCHHKAVLGWGKEVEILKRMKLDCDFLDSGCCGMAGAFGFEAKNYPVSVACGETVLLPAIRNAKPDDLIVADGFSCREQIKQLTGRRALHIAQVLEAAIREGPNGPVQSPPEQRYVDVHKTAALPLSVALGIGGLLLGGAYVYGELRNGNGRGSRWHNKQLRTY